MQRNRYAPQLPMGMVLLLFVGACSVPTQRQSLDATARLVAGQVAAPLEWRLDPKADAEALQRAEALFVDGLTLEEAIRVAFLASPDLQLALEQVEISRADLVAASTASNPVLVVGSREPSGALANFYPERTITLGVVQSVIDLLRIPGRRDIARYDVERARHEAAHSAVRLAGQVAQAWIEYGAALQILGLRQRALAIVQVNYDNLLAAPDGDADIVETLEVERGNLLERKADVIRAKLAVARSRAALDERLGIADWRDDWDVQPTLPPLPDSDPELGTEERAAMERRLDLMAGNQAFEARLRVLANHRRFRWLNQLDLGLFRDQATGGTEFIGPNVAIELPLFDQRLATLLNADSQLRSELRSLDAARLAARSEIRTHAAEMSTARQLLEQIDLEIQPGQRQLLASPVGGNPDDAGRSGVRLAILATEEGRVELLRDYWRARSALALAAGDWGALSGLR